MSEFFGEQQTVDAAAQFGRAHVMGDTDQSPNSMHHTLGTSPSQAAPGNHSHGIQAGLTPSAGTSGTITFKYRYRANPIIQLTPSVNATVWVTALSTTGFSWSASVSTQVFWTAMGLTVGSV